MQTEDSKTINMGTHQTSQHVFANLQTREAQALDAHAEFFSQPEHQHKVSQVIDIVDNFFPVRKALYVNHRSNRGKPFTVIKVERPQFPRMKSQIVEALYRKPLADLKVEVVFSANTLSYLYRVY